jgi:hypothetical protein
VPNITEELFPDEFYFYASAYNTNFNFRFVQLQGFVNDFTQSNIFVEVLNDIKIKNFSSKYVSN